ncbi:MAG: threonine/serine dehydratase [Clostridiales bacterium]|nr:threonine/serine dehydratase [Clostridiales bacterium]
MINVKEAYENIKNLIYMTPLDKSLTLSGENQNVYLKKECLQPVKSFKLRGAMNKMMSLTEEEKNRGVTTISSGNHGLAVSCCASLLGIKNAKVIVPTITPAAKTDKISAYGAEVILLGDNYDEAHTKGMKFVEESGMTYIDPYDKDPLVYAGQGTAGMEIMMQNEKIDTILVPVGGGGLVTGVSLGARLLNPNVKIIGVQTEACPAMKASIEDDVCYAEYPSDDSICEALIGGIGELAFKMNKECIDDIIIVKESYIRKAVKLLALKEKTVTEPSGAITVAALLQGEKIPGKNIACVLSGGNVDDQLFIDLLNE